MPAVVLIVKVAVATDVPEMFTGEVAPNVKVGGSTAPAGLEVRAADSAILPVKPPLGVAVMIEVLAVVAPARMETDEPLIVKLEGEAAVTCTVFEPEAP